MPNWYRKLFICPLCEKRHGISLIKRHSSNRKQDDKGRWILQPFFCKNCGGELKAAGALMNTKRLLTVFFWLIPISRQTLMFVNYEWYSKVMHFYTIWEDMPAVRMATPPFIAFLTWLIISFLCEAMVPFEGQPDGQKKKRTRDRTVSQMLKNEPTYPDGIKGILLRERWIWLTLIWVIWMYRLGAPFDIFNGFIGDLPNLLGRHSWLS